ncbi:GH25 family lysozyme [Cryobacterium sp. GrIS_2_6]|uniref:GH25 family lysozyme n=1 Tax=Cryobacterium sp. GrIS_2_6 TaxID=3162785 RepID=UPI002E0C2C2D|nr:GH25 family lysozyme [Cryobacterium psychrotolerans]MEC5149135.1 hypothetical protein [Cryobacterium psychrotolerans]MEC5149214.1 hypothetical protein [Cryobacterium psychrotolerans]MEC5149295.1 hypothetical protein [Cryobacterium psychrotolerans]
MLDGIDAATPQSSLDWALAHAQGFRHPYIKLGGDNNGRYVAPHYAAECDLARSAGEGGIGHYWVPSAAKDPTEAADYFVDHLHGWAPGDFWVLDNEPLDGCRQYNDGQAAAFANRVNARLRTSGLQGKTYLGLSVANSQSWPALLATGCDIVIAAYSYAPFAYTLATIPADRNHGHQTGGVTIGGIAVDHDVWKDDAFNFAATAATTITPLAPPTPKDDDMTVYLKPTDNSSPLPDGTSRIWTGYRTLDGIEYADVWGVDGNGTARRLTAIQWRILNALPKTAITLNVVEVTGNELEQIVFAPAF